MRGTPWLRLCFVAAFLALLAVPVWHVTSHSDHTPTLPSPKADTASAGFPVTLRIDASAPWSSISLTLLGKNIPCTTSDNLSASATLTLPDSGADLVISVTWPEDNGHHALRIRARNDRTHRDLLDHTLWGREHILDAITLPPSP